MRQDSAVTLLSEGMYFDDNVLDAERQRITNKLLQNGYYKFNKAYISYTADTVRNSYLVDLTLHLAPYRQHNEDTPQNHRQSTIKDVYKRQTLIISPCIIVTAATVEVYPLMMLLLFLLI